MREEGKQQSPAVIIDKPGDESANFEQAMLLTGYGRYNLILLFACGISMTSFGCQSGLSAYILPSAKCDLKLSSDEMGLLNAAFLIGATTGTIGSGTIADAIGRRKVLIWSLFIDGCVTLLSSLTQNFALLFASRCINGFAVGGPTTIILIFVGEFHAEKSRANAICYLGLFWAFSTLLLPAMAWIIIPLKFDIVVYGLVFNSWRLFLSIFSLPSLLGAFLISRYPETPKFLLSRGQNINALKVMREMFASNTRQEAHDYPVKTLISEYSTTYNELNTFSNTLNKMWEQVCCLFSPLLAKYTILSGFILFANMFGYYGLGLWLPELFNRFELYHRSHPNVTITVCELAYLRQKNYETTVANASEHSYKTYNSTMEIGSIWSNTTTVQLLADNTPEICDGSVDAKVFLNTIIIGFCCLLGSWLTGYLANRWERRVMPIATMLIAGICGCVIYFLRTSFQNLIVTCIFSSFISMANIVIYSAIIQVFPTNVGAMATSVSSVLGRLGGILSNILFGALLDISCEVPIFLVGGVVIFGGILGCLLPKYPLALPEKFQGKSSISDKNLSKSDETEHSHSTTS